MLTTQQNVYSFPETHFFCTTMRFVERDENGFIKVECLESVFQNIKEKTEHDFASAAKKEIYDLAENHQLSAKLLFEYLVRGLLLKQVEEDRLPKILWVEKTPGHIFQLEIIHDLYPKGRFIEIVRNPLNAIYSCKNKYEDIDHLTPSALAHRWKRATGTYKQFQEKYRQKGYSVKYEDLVKDPDGEFTKMSNFLNIIPDIEKLNDVQKTASQLVLKRETWKKNNLNSGITNRNIDYKWAVYEKLNIEYLLRVELAEMGYSNGYALSQMIFNIGMDFVSMLTKSKFLSPLKKPIKYLARKMGLWPF